MNRQQIIEQAETMLNLLSTLDANEVAQVLGTAIVLHLAKCATGDGEFLKIYQEFEKRNIQICFGRL